MEHARKKKSSTKGSCQADRRIRECEAKFLYIDKLKLIQKLQKLGAKLTFNGTIVTEIYETFQSKEKQVLRIRSVGKRNFLTLKTFTKTSSRTKNMEELEVEVSSGNVAGLILKNLGYKSLTVFKKNRTSYRLGNIMFCIDKFQKTPPYLEIEADSSESVFNAIEALGLNPNEAKPWTGQEVLAQYKRDKA